MTTARSVLVVGGGIAGLSAAYELMKQGVPFLLLEAGPRLGGVVFSERIDGFTVDAGPDSLLVQKPEAITLCRELGLGARLVPTREPRIAYIQRAGRLHPLPAASVLGIPTEWGPFIRTPLFTLAGKLRMGAELMVPPRRDDGDESIGAFMRRRFGHEATTFLAEPLLAGIHAGDVDRLSVRALFPRLREAEQRFGSLLRAFRQQPRQASPDGAFRSLPGGLSELTDALAAALPAGAVRDRSAATRLWRDDHGYRVETVSGETHAAAGIILATPAHATAPLLKDMAPVTSRLSADIPYASVATVAFAFQRDAVSHPLNGSGFVVPRVEGTGILAGSWLSSKWPHRAPEGHVLLRAFLGGARDPEALDRTDAGLTDVALRAMAPLLGLSGDPIFSRVYRWVRANAQHEVGHLDRTAAIERDLENQPGLWVTGSAYRGVGVPDCVADGRATARKAADWLRR